MKNLFQDKLILVAAIVGLIAVVALVVLLCLPGSEKTPDPTTPSTEATDATDATEATEATDATDATEATEPTEATEADLGASLNFEEEGRVVLYDTSLKTPNEDFYNVGNVEYDDFGLVVSGQRILQKAYGITDRTVHYVCKFGADTVARFPTVISLAFTGGTINTDVLLFVGNKQLMTRAGTYDVPFINDTDTFLVSVSKHFLQLIVEITNLNTGETGEYVYENTGAGGYGQGAVATAVSTGMQYDYYCLDLHSGSPFSVSRMVVTCGDCDLLMYGDSITEPEAYWPANVFEKNWVQLTIDNFTGGTALSSGRSGCTIDSVLERIKNELPYIQPKYCMVTIGTNGHNTPEKLTELVQFIKSCGAIPILNHIPCYDNAGEKTGFIQINQDIDTVRQNEGITGCDFDLVTSVAGDGKEVDITTMWYEDYGTKAYYHHPNEKGSAQMFEQLKKDLPELFQ